MNECIVIINVNVVLVDDIGTNLERENFEEIICGPLPGRGTAGAVRTVTAVGNVW